MVTRELQEHQMLVHLFKAMSSPACANFALRKTAEDNEDSFSLEVTNTVKRNFYVDDCLKSLPSEPNAIAHANSLQSLLPRGGFRLTKWISNSPMVNEVIPHSERSKEIKSIDTNKDDPHVQRALGIAKRTITKNRFVSVRSHETPAQSQTNIATKTKKMYERELRL